MTTQTPLDPLAAAPNPEKAAAACRQLIRAYQHDPSHVDWSEVQTALGLALEAFALGQDFLEAVNEADE